MVVMETKHWFQLRALVLCKTLLNSPSECLSFSLFYQRLSSHKIPSRNHQIFSGFKIMKYIHSGVRREEGAVLVFFLFFMQS